VTRLTIRDVAALMISFDDNSATNIIIDRIGMKMSTRCSIRSPDTHASSPQDDGCESRRGRPRKHRTPREMVQLLEDLYRGKVLNKQMTDDFFSLLSVHKESYIPRELPEDLRVANSPESLRACGMIPASFSRGNGRSRSA